MPSRQRHLLGNDLVRESRRRAGLTQRELAAKAGTTQSAIARLESGRTAPSFEMVLSLVRACGLDLEVMVVERDYSDMWRAQDMLKLPAAERVRTHQRTVHQLQEFRRAGEALRGGTA